MRSVKQNKQQDQDSETLYSYNELLSIGKAMDNLLVKSRDKKYHRTLIYLLNKNLKYIQEEINHLTEGIQDLPEEVNEYTQKVRDVAVESGGVKRQNEQGEEYIDVKVEGFNQEEFDDKASAIEEEYKKVIDEANEVNRENAEYKEEKISDIKLYNLQLKYFPEEINLDDMPMVLIDLIEE